ncbi:MAG: DUF515 domain-containing protein [Methanobrevibacter sp.]|nr:DUF515 domain-containing protein [Methanobrevibacter sp.]
MNNERPDSPFYPPDYDDEDQRELKREIQQTELYKPKPKEKPLKDDLKIFEKINRKISMFLSPKSIELSDDEKKKKIGVIITTLIIFVLIVSCYYFLIYEPSQKNLEEAKTEKLNQLHSLYKGPLASASEAFTLEKKIKDCKSAMEVNTINIIGPATKDWKEFQKKSINSNQDQFNRTMAIYESDGNKSVIMPIDDALKLVNDNGVDVISNIKFETPNTISVPILISRLQAGAGLLSVGSVVDIFTQNTMNNTTNSENTTSLSLSGCTVISIMRCEESGEIESEYGTSKTQVSGNVTNPNENTDTFTANVIEMIKGSLAGGYNEKQTMNMLENYGIKLSNSERQINLAEIDAQYLLLVEVPHDKVNYVINNMDSLVLTIPTKNAPDWMASEIKATYAK